MSRLALGILVVALVSGCGKLSDAQKQAASDIASGLAGGTGKSIANNAAALVGSAPATATCKIGKMLEGAMWLTRFKIIDTPMVDRWSRGVGVVTIDTNDCDDGNNTYCSSSCPTTSSFKVACTFGSTAADYTCNGTTYEFTNGTFSITADFANTGGSYHSATGNFALNISIGGNVSGGALEGKTFECSMNFTIDVAGLKAGTVTHFSPSCSNFSCKYDGKDLSCKDIQSKMSSSTISCS